MIEVEGLQVPRGGFALRADLRVGPGEICAVIGPSGAGKSTLLEAIAGFAPPSAGTIRVAGRDLGDAPPSDRPVTLLFQDHNLFPHLDLRRNLGLGLRGGLRLSAADDMRIEAALAETGLAGLSARRPDELSGGQRRRAALARALLRDRPVLLLDEPFEGLGPALREELGDLIAAKTAERGLAALMVTHDPDDARRIAATVAPCLDGRIKGARPTAEALDRPDAALAAYLGRR
ncbi:MAG: ATP-binding cassette domain-containing protein [Pseudomonadota bacterium]